MKRTTMAVLVAVGIGAAPVAMAQSQTQTQGQPQSQQQDQRRFQETVDVKGESRSGTPNEHFMTFSGPVSVPGVTLPAGTYIFKFPLEEDLTRTGSQPVIQVLKPDDAHGDAYAMFHAISVRDVSRTLATETYEVKWRERDEDAPPAIEALYLPGESIGYEFLYKSTS